MNKRFFSFILLCLYLFPLFAQTPDYVDEIKKYTSNLPFEMGEVKIPHFREASYNIKEYGAIPDGHTLNTAAINKAISECSEQGGGKVIIPSGLWVTGPLLLKSNVNLHAEKGALVLFSKDHKNYPIVKMPVKGFSVMSPVLGYNLENIAITGEGIFDGAGETWRPVKKSKFTASQWKNLLKSGGYLDEKNSIWYPTKEAYDGLQTYKKFRTQKNLTEHDFIPYRESMRPYMVLLINCKNVFIENVTIQNSPMFALHPIQCENVILRSVKINNEWWAQNGDGIDINSCDNVLVYKCTVTAGDDAICMKADDGKKKPPVLHNVVIADCIVYNGHGGFVIGSGTNGGMKNISVKNCTFIGTDIGLRFKSARDRGGLVENIFIDGIYMKNILHEAILFDFSYEQDLEENKNKEEKLPFLCKFNINNVICSGAETAVYINALEESPVKEINITNSYFETDSGIIASFASGITFDKVHFNIKKDNLISLNQSDKINFSGITFSDNIKSFIFLKGDKTSLVKISGTDLLKLAEPVSFSPEVNKNSIEITNPLKKL